MFSIDRFDFQDGVNNEIQGLTHDGNNVGENWPVVYVINNDKEAYIGETVSASRRSEQHLKNPEKRRLTEIRIITDDDFNKSVILDLESFLIQHMSSDGKYVLQNSNGGLQDHNYYERSQYEQEFADIWTELKKLGVVDQTIEKIENTDLFKYSPYKSLGAEQRTAEKEIIEAFAEGVAKGKNVTVLVRGGAGTGKTILAVYLLKLFADLKEKRIERDDEFDEYIDEPLSSIYAAEHIYGIEKIGIVLPQASLRSSFSDVFSHISGLESSMILSATDVVDDYAKTKKKFDLLIVDEAHRLKCRNKGHLTQYPKFDACNRVLGLDKKEGDELGNELDWILMCSENQIIFRDERQTFRPCDIDAETFRGRINSRKDCFLVEQALETQWRCRGGRNYIDYINGLLSCRLKKAAVFNDDDYEFVMYTDVDRMIKDIKALDAKYGLCRNVAGYAWQWKSKKDKNALDIEIQGHKYRWNSTYDNWIVQKNAVDEIGCIHTVQGYDLNYVGVIIGRDIYYDPKTGQIAADKKNYFDQQGKAGAANDPEALTMYLRNIYLTLMTRGIRGTYVYVCDNALREYFAKYVPVRK